MNTYSYEKFLSDQRRDESHEDKVLRKHRGLHAAVLPLTNGLTIQSAKKLHKLNFSKSDNKIIKKYWKENKKTMRYK